jgi:threonine-phosphate decarboxylase
MIEGHGNDIFRGRRSVVVDFSSNVATPKPHPKLIQHLARNLDVIANYPETNAQSLREKLATRHDVKTNQVLVTNGSTEAFYLIAAAFREKQSLVFTPSFSEYEDACKMHQHGLTFVPVKQFDEPFETSPALVWLGNPNNPEGTVAKAETIEQKLQDYPETLFIVDEAYGEVCSSFESVVQLTIEYDNLIVVRSLTKLFSIPGLRLGYLVASEKWTKQIQEQMQPWSVNALSIEAGKYIFHHEKELVPDISEILWQSRRLQNQLSLIPGLNVTDSNCNYFLVELEKGSAAQLKEYLLNEHGFLIRDASNFRGLNNRFFRIASQSKKINEALVEAIKKWTDL